MVVYVVITKSLNVPVVKSVKNDEYVCFVVGETPNTEFKWFCQFQQQYYELGLNEPQNLSAINQVIYNKSFVDRKMLILFNEYQPTALLIYCSISDLRSKVYTVPKRIPIIEVKKINDTLLRCNIYRRRTSSNLVFKWFAFFFNTSYDLSLKNKAPQDFMEKYYFDNIIVNDTLVKLEYAILNQNIMCSCRVLLVLYDVELVKEFLLPYKEIPSLIIVPSNFTFNTKIKCSTDANDELWLFEFYCSFQQTHFILGNSTAPPQLNAFYAYVYKAMNVTGNTLKFGLFYQPEIIPCLCKAHLIAIPSVNAHDVSFKVPISVKTILKIVPEIFTFNSTITCTTISNDIYFEILFFCLFKNQWIELSEGRDLEVDEFAQYVYDSLTVQHNTLYFGLIYNPVNITCLCNAIFSVMPSIYKERVFFTLPISVNIKTKIVPDNLLFDSSITCGVGSSLQAFTIQLFCRFAGKFYHFGNDTVFLSSPFDQYVFKSCSVNTHTLHIGIIYQPTIIPCYCNAYFTVNSTIYNQNVTFQLPRSGILSVKIVPKIFKFHKTIACNTNSYNDPFTIEFYCYFSNVYVKLGNISQSLGDAFYLYVYKSLVINSNNLYFKEIYQPDDITCLCCASFDIHPIKANASEFFRLPKSGKATMNIYPKTYTFDSTISCSNGLNEELFMIEFYCKFNSGTVKVENETIPFLTKIDQYIYSSLFVNWNTIYFGLIYQPYVLGCYCRIVLNEAPKKFNASISFNLPKSALAVVKMQPMKYTFNSQTTCTISENENMYSREIFCLFDQKYYKLGLESAPPVSKINKYVYMSLTIVNNTVFFGPIYQPEVILCYCNAFLTAVPVLFNVNVSFTLPRSAIASVVLNPPNPKTHSTMSCNVIPSDMGFNITYVCHFPSKSVTINTKTDGLTAYEQYIFNRLEQTGKYLFFNFSYQILSIFCFCEAFVYDLYSFTSQSFDLPTNVLPTINITPQVPRLYQDVMCKLSSGDDTFKYAFYCKFDGIHVLMGESQIPNISIQFIYLYKRLKVRNENMSLAYLHFESTVFCMCQAIFKFGTEIVKSETFPLPLSSSQPMKIEPAIPKIDIPMKCQVGNYTEFFQIFWLCDFENGFVNMSTHHIFQSDYNNYMFANIQIDLYNRLGFNFPINIKNISCMCHAVYIPDPTLEFQNIDFQLPLTERPVINITTVVTNQIISICSIVNFTSYFVFHWECDFENHTYVMEDPNIDSIVDGRIKYVFKNILTKNNKIIIFNLFNEDDVKCECLAYFLNKSTILGIYRKDYTIYKSKLPFLTTCSLNCTNKSCTYNVYTNNSISIRCDYNFPRALEYVNFILTSVALKFHLKRRATNALHLYPFHITNAKVTVGCKDIHWSIIWNNSVVIVKEGEWSIYFINKSSNEVMVPPIKIKNKAFIKNITLTCYLVDPQKFARLTWVYSINNWSFIDLIYVQNHVLRTVIEYASQSNVTVTCTIFSLSLIYKEWCRIYEYGNNTVFYTIKSFERLIATPPSNTSIKLPTLITVNIEMYYPINITVVELILCPSFNVYINGTFYPRIPMVDNNYYVGSSTVEGFYQMLFNYEASILLHYESDILSYAFYNLPVNIYLSPNIFARGSIVICKTNSTDSLFVFFWYCLFDGHYYAIKKNYGDHPSAEVSQKLSNIILIDSQTIMLDYLIRSDTYECMCLVTTLVEVSNRTINFSKTFIFIIKDYVPGDLPLGKTLFSYMVLTMIGMLLFHTLLFGRISLYQVHQYNTLMVTNQLLLLHKYEQYKVVSNAFTYRSYTINHSQFPLFHYLTFLAKEFDNGNLIIRPPETKSVKSFKISMIKKLSKTNSKSLFAPLTDSMSANPTDDIREFYRNQYKLQDRRLTFTERKTSTLLKELQAEDNTDKVPPKPIKRKKRKPRKKTKTEPVIRNFQKPTESHKSRLAAKEKSYVRPKSQPQIVILPKQLDLPDTIYKNKPKLYNTTVSQSSRETSPNFIQKMIKNLNESKK